MGSQIPRPWCFPLLKYEINAVFSGFGPGFGTTLFYDDDFIADEGVRNAVTFYSDVNSAARRDVLTGPVPYQDVSYAEDQLFGRDVIAAGLIKAYAPRAAAIHSNDMTLAEYDDRMEAETLGQREVGIAVAVPSVPVVGRMMARGVVKDTARLLRDRDFGLRRKLCCLVLGPLYHVQKWRGVQARGACRTARTDHPEGQRTERSRMTGTPLRDLETPLDAGCRILAPVAARGQVGEEAGGDDDLRSLLGTVANSEGPLLGVRGAGRGRTGLADHVRPRPGTRERRPCAGPPPGRHRAGGRLRLRAGHPVPGENCTAVDTLEADPAQAAVARARTRDLTGVEIFVGSLEHVPPTPRLRRRRRGRRARDRRRGDGGPRALPGVPPPLPAVLRPGGTLVLAIGNPLGVKYLSGAADDHTGRPFDSLEGYLLEYPSRTFPGGCWRG